MVFLFFLQGKSEFVFPKMNCFNGQSTGVKYSKEWDVESSFSGSSMKCNMPLRIIRPTFQFLLNQCYFPFLILIWFKLKLLGGILTWFKLMLLVRILNWFKIKINQIILTYEYSHASTSVLCQNNNGAVHKIRQHLRGFNQLSTGGILRGFFTKNLQLSTWGEGRVKISGEVFT